MRVAVVLAVLLAAACGSESSGTVLNIAQLKFAVMRSVGEPQFCDPDLYPVARAGGEVSGALAAFPAIRADKPTYSAILAYEHLPTGPLPDEDKLVVYRAWKLLQALALTHASGDYTFKYRVLPARGSYEMVGGAVQSDGAVKVISRSASGPPICPV